MKEFLEKIRYSENDKKKPWLIGLSVAAMVIIIAGWVVYMNSFVLQSATDQQQIESAGVGFWPVFKNGLEIAGSAISNKISGIISDITGKIPAIGSKNSITIENPDVK